MPTADLMNALPVSEARFYLDRGQEISGQSSGVIRVKDLRPALWRARIVCAAMTHLEERQAMALIGDIEDLYSTFYVWKPNAPYPYADPGGSILGASAVKINSLNADNKRLSLKGLPNVLGSELFPVQSAGSGTNWAFDSGNQEWDKTPGAGNALNLNVDDLDAGATYKLAWTMRNRTAGDITPVLTGGTNVTGTLRSANGSYVDYLVALAGNTTITFQPNAPFDGSIALVSLKKVTAFYTLTRGDFLSFDYGAEPARALHQVVTATVTANGLGVTAEFTVTPHIRVGAAVNDAVLLALPAAEMMIVPGSYEPNTRGALSSMGFEAVQRI